MACRQPKTAGAKMVKDTQHNIVPIAQDLTSRSIYIVDTFAATNLVRHLDDASTGGSSPFAVVQLVGLAGISDLYSGGSDGNKALYALTQTSPEIVPDARCRVAKIDLRQDTGFWELENPVAHVQYRDAVSIAPTPLTCDRARSSSRPAGVS